MMICMCCSLIVSTTNSPNRYWTHSELKLDNWQTVIDLDRLIHPRIKYLSGFHEDITLGL